MHLHYVRHELCGLAIDKVFSRLEVSMSENSKRIYVYSLLTLSFLYHWFSGMDTLLVLIAAAMATATVEVTLMFRKRKG